MSELKNTYNKIANDWHEDHKEDMWWREGVDHLISLLPPHASILDVGCGAGHKSKYFSDRRLQVTGVDFSEGMIAVASKQVPTAHFQVLDMYKLDSLSETFDCVFAQASLLHIPKRDIPLVLGKLLQRLKPDGLLYVAVKEVREGDPEEKIEIENDYGYEYQRFFSYFTKDEVHTALQVAGLEIVKSEVIQPGKTRWVQAIARKK